MDFIEGISVHQVLPRMTESEEVGMLLSPDAENVKLDYVYEQIAGFCIQLAQFDFSKIGALSKDVCSGKWLASGRPLTYDKNELRADVFDYPDAGFPTAPFKSGRAFFDWLADESLVHLHTQGNIAYSHEEARQAYIARQCIKHLISERLCDDSAHFKPICDDFRPGNMLVNPDTLEIVAVLDFELSNSMPSEFTYAPPNWLLLRSAGDLLLKLSFARFKELYVPRLNQSIAAVERVEARDLTLMQAGSVRLSARMRESWATGKFRLVNAVRSGFHLDAIYWAAIHRPGNEALVSASKEELDGFAEKEINQFIAYCAECNSRGV